jgi:hypothetical protein
MQLKWYLNGKHLAISKKTEIGCRPYFWEMVDDLIEDLRNTN